MILSLNFIINIIFIIIIFLRKGLTLPVEGGISSLASRGGSDAALGGGGGVAAENIKKFAELYGIATQIMNLGGEVLSGGRGSSSASGNSLSRYMNNYSNKLDGNSINGGDIVRPTFRGVSGYEPSPTLPTNYGGGFLGSKSGYGAPNLGGSSSYGSGPVQSARMSGLEQILHGFLGSSFGSNSYTSTATKPDFFNTKKPNEFESNTYSGKGSNIDAIMNALMRSGARKADELPDENRNILSQFFGK
ncbi:Hypothetical protein SRAE_2000408200 [Strongyloides ratti]|uniref:Uncharacterized protein n=1 Tax=Strongyloides ratti TaxID=34506 RepID=A0A090LMN5_STRRB|nr:Hypothetical protein SRAE_2000408200 [Strongyloides ratti]CEF69433.1 Hypothetical protein SRAE_2000408200 [Strongyloides ratti]